MSGGRRRGASPDASDSSVPESQCAALLHFFSDEGRDLPWRVEPRDPYHTLVSELMAQQTQIDRVVPKFLEFIRRFPVIESLAAASEEDVLATWSGLGYYRRARLLHAAACRVSLEGGDLPSNPEELEKLPGIGPYTAAAVASLAFNVAAPVLDGNVLRVGARILGIGGDPRRVAVSSRIRTWVQSIFRWGSPGRVNEALMELGALRCTPNSPRCRGCPFEDSCRAHWEGREEEIPEPRRTRSSESQDWVAACLCRSDGALLLQRIDEGDILRGLWLPPIGRVEKGERLEEAAARLLPDLNGSWRAQSPLRHSITYRRMRVHPLFCEGGIDAEYLDGRQMWFRPGGPQFPSSSLLNKLLRCLEQAGVTAMRHPSGG